MFFFFYLYLKQCLVLKIKISTARRRKEFNSPGHPDDRIVFKRLVLSMSVTSKHNVTGEIFFLLCHLDKVLIELFNFFMIISVERL